MRLPDLNVSTVGGSRAVDFFNTVDWRLDPERKRDRLPSYLHLLAWAQQLAVVSRSEVERLAQMADDRPGVAEAEHALVRELRDDTYDALAGGHVPATLQRQLHEAHSNSKFQRTAAGVWDWSPSALDLRTPRLRLTLELASLATSPDLLLFHRCEDQHCGWVFLDRSRQGNRRWCSSAECGNRNRVRAHYARTRSGRAEPL